MLWEDNPPPFSPYGKYPNGMPCSYNVSTWVGMTAAMNDAVSKPVMINGLNTFSGSATSPSPVIGDLVGVNTVGGDLEGCYSSLNQPISAGSQWFAMENTELSVLRRGKWFECLSRDVNSAAGNVPSRIWTLASFLLSYDPYKAILAEEYATPSGLRVMPESGLVALNPILPEPPVVSYLKRPSGAYGREYAHCYLRGASVGACAVAVTNDYGAPHAFPFRGYTRTLSLRGNGVLDGGTASAYGPPPPSIMQPYTAVIAFK
jgi:hypothetical protein